MLEGIRKVHLTMEDQLSLIKNEKDTNSKPRPKYDSFKLVLERMIAVSTLKVALNKGNLIELPNEILPGFLWLGDAVQASSPWVFEQLRFTYVVNVSAGLSPFTEKFPDILKDIHVNETLKEEAIELFDRLSRPTYLRIKIRDSPDEDILCHLSEVEEFINEAYEKQQKVLVHCQAGVSRSATLVIGYLLKCKRMDLNDAYDFVKKSRPQINPNPGFREQLKELERSMTKGTSNGAK